jgi:hypothetical protein
MGGAKEMNRMFTLNATEVRRNWSAVMESVVREKPRFIKRTRDYMVLADVKLFEHLLAAYHFTADKFTEEDGSITLSLRELDLVEHAQTEAEAKELLGKSILDYAEDFYQEFSLWSAAPNRKSHIPYVLKALVIDDAVKIGDSIECRPGRN